MKNVNCQKRSFASTRRNRHCKIHSLTPCINIMFLSLLFILDVATKVVNAPCPLLNSTDKFSGFKYTFAICFMRCRVDPSELILFFFFFFKKLSTFYTFPHLTFAPTNTLLKSTSINLLFEMQTVNVNIFMLKVNSIIFWSLLQRTLRNMSER